MKRRACVIGSGPNGLAAAILLAQAGLAVDVFEAESTPGGAARSMELTLPGFIHDFGSAVHPWAVGSPFFSSLPLRDYGLEWIHSPAPLAHPFEDGSALVLERELSDAEKSLGADGKAWNNLMRPFVSHWTELAPEILQPVHVLSPHPLLMARLGFAALRSAQSVAHSMFRNERTRGLFAGFAAHSFLKMTDSLSAAFGILLAVSAHAVGWPIPRGGSQALTNALCGHLAKLGGKLSTSTRIEQLDTLRDYEMKLCDVAPQQLLKMGNNRLAESYKQKLRQFRYGPAAFKVDFALSQPVPWKAKECARAATVHIGGSFAEIAESEEAMATGQHAEKPFLILAQPSLFDSTRAPDDRHTAWAYCHVPNGSTFDMLPRIEAQIERFAPGFRDCILAKKVFSPAALQAMDANLIGGDIGGGAMNLRQFLFRPTRLQYQTSANDIFLCSSSTPPGAGVHGMCGYHAASLALSRMR